jgi:transglutaminase-like putative cysteine protease
MAEMEWTRPAPTAPARVVPLWLKSNAARFLDWEDWLTLGLLLGAVVSVSAALESAGWSKDMPAITLVSVMAAVAAMFLDRSRLAMILAWPLSLAFGTLVTFWQTLVMVGPGTLEQRLDAIYVRFDLWFDLALHGGVSKDPLPLDVLVIGLTWLGVFVVGWSVFRWHNAWIGLLPGGAALFIDMAFVGDSLTGAAILYVLFGFLLVMRTNLVSRIVRWRAEGTQYPTLISLTFLNFSAWLLVLLIIAAWVAPAGPFATPAPVRAAVTAFEKLGIDFVRLSGPLRSQKVIPVHGYSGVLPFQGSIKLGDRELLAVKVSDPDIQGPLVLRGSVYDRYSSGGWETGARQETNLPLYALDHLNRALSDGDVEGTVVPLEIDVTARSVIGTVVFTPGQPVSSDEPLKVQAPAGSIGNYDIRLPRDGRFLLDEEILRDYLKRPFLSVDADLVGISVQRDGRRVISVLAFDAAQQALPDALTLQPPDRIRRGESYRVTGFVPAVTPDELRAAPTLYPNWVTSQYLQRPDGLPPRVAELAQSIAAEAANPYDKAKAIESYLRAYPVDYRVEDTPPSHDTVDYFLFEARRGYFDYHASAMVMMLRANYVPARLAVGFVVDGSDFDEDLGAYIVRDRNSYAWPEVYFPGHGWVAFNPTPDRPADLAPATRSDSGTDGIPSLEDFPDLPVTADPNIRFPDESLLGVGGSAPSSRQGGGSPVPWFALGALAFLAAVAGAAALGWQRSVSDLPYSQQMWEKTVRLASWGGHPPAPGQTPTDFARSLRRRFHALRGISAIADAYNRSRYAGREASAQERAEIAELWPPLRRALTGEILGRLLRRR